MRKTIVLYGRRNTGMVVLPYLVVLGYNVKVVSNDELVLWMAKSLGCEVVTIDNMGDFQIFISVHGDKIVPMKYLEGKKAYNIHPCLFKYKGHNPIKIYIENKDTIGSVGCHIMTDKVDEGDVVCEYVFETGVVDSYASFYNIAMPYYFKVIDKILKA